MDATLVMLLLGIALLAIVVLPTLLRKKTGDNTASPLPDGMHDNTPAPRDAKMTTLEEIQSQWFARWLCEQAQAQTGSDLTQDPMALARIGEAAKKAQAEIDAGGKAEISLPYIAADAAGPKHFSLKVTREQLAIVRHRAG
jgi:hypothetical protein